METVSYQMSADELVRAGFRLRARKPAFIGMLAVIALGGLVLLFADDTFWAGVLLLGFAAFAPFQLRGALRRLVTGCEWYTAPTTLGFDDSKVTIEAPGHRWETTWPTFRSWSLTPEHLFLFIDKHGENAVTIPTRAFSADQLSRFQSYLR